MIELIIRLIVAAVEAAQKRQQKLREAGPLPGRPAAPSPRVAARDPAAAARLGERLDAVARRARVEARACEAEEANQPFVRTLGSFVPDAAAEGRRQLGAKGPAYLRWGEALALRLERLVAVLGRMAEQRRDEDLLLLLGDSDALAEACYAPIVAYARAHNIKLASERAATFLGDKSVAAPEIWLGFDPGGLAPVVLPLDWRSEIGWWPALAHEIGHDFHASVAGLDEELRGRANLPARGPLPDGGSPVTLDDVAIAISWWLPELFADAFGTLMLGPAYVATMMWRFGNPSEPQQTRVIAPIGPREKPNAYDEHPPGHVRVVAACALLGEIGFPAEGDALEAEWRRNHGLAGSETASLYLPTRRGRWLAVPETPYLERIEELLANLYEQGLPSLSGVSLRSIPGLDLGPREHAAAIEVKQELLQRRRTPSVLRDPRILIAGAVLAWRAAPGRGAELMAAVRAAIPAVGVPRRRLRARAAASARDSAPARFAGVGIDELREAVIFSAILERPRRRR